MYPKRFGVILAATAVAASGYHAYRFRGGGAFVLALLPYLWICARLDRRPKKTRTDMFFFVTGLPLIYALIYILMSGIGM